MEEIAKGSETGRIFGNGPAEVGKHFKQSKVAAVKNQSIAAYDPRPMIGNGITFATSTMEVITHPVIWGHVIRSCSGSPQKRRTE
jgi:aldehyde:ferredoxin oxidoreductase